MGRMTSSASLLSKFSNSLHYQRVSPFHAVRYRQASSIRISSQCTASCLQHGSLRQMSIFSTLISSFMIASLHRKLRCENYIVDVDSSIEVGDIVFTRVHDRNSRLDPLFSEPHRVIESLHDHKVKILDLKTKRADCPCQSFEAREQEI